MLWQRLRIHYYYVFVVYVIHANKAFYLLQVTYDVNNFIDKNNDPLFRDMSVTMFLCDHLLLKDMFPEGLQMFQMYFVR